MMTPLRTRQSITWRIPIDLLERIDKHRKRTKDDRTAVVVAALELYLKTAARLATRATRGTR